MDLKKCATTAFALANAAPTPTTNNANLLTSVLANEKCSTDLVCNTAEKMIAELGPWESFSPWYTERGSRQMCACKICMDMKVWLNDNSVNGGGGCAHAAKIRQHCAVCAEPPDVQVVSAE